MLNFKVGAPHDVDGDACIVTDPGRSGFATYGPYARLKAGEYAAEFVLALPVGGRAGTRIAVLDISRDGGNQRIAARTVTAEEVGSGWTRLALRFTLDRVDVLEFRVWVSGEASLLIRDTAHAVPLIVGDDPCDVLADPSFPAAARDRVPFLAAHEATLRSLHERGILVRVRGDEVVLGTSRVAIHARVPDDLTFTGEIFLEGAYNLQAQRPLCMVDIGMNIGLASLMFAARPEVREVHAYEPFAGTFARAQANLALNPGLAAKIQAHPFGLSDRDVDGPLRLLPTGDSGSASVVEHVHGEPFEVVLRDAGAVLAPIAAGAAAQGLDLVVKVDCEGSEFAVFESLERHGLLGSIAAFMVEWHAIFHDRDQETLLAPLRAAGFLVFDRSPPEGNGFFYAVRVGSGQPMPA